MEKSRFSSKINESILMNVLAIIKIDQFMKLDNLIVVYIIEVSVPAYDLQILQSFSKAMRKIRISYNCDIINNPHFSRKFETYCHL